MAGTPIPKIGPDATALASQYNSVVDAIQDPTCGHEHTGAQGHGQVVSHHYLLDEAINASSGHTHAVIDAHIDAWRTEVGAHALHGLASGLYLPGAMGSQLVFQVSAAAETTDDWTGVVGGPNGTDWGDQIKTVTFPIAFTTIIAVFVMPCNGTAGQVAVDTLTPTTFRARLSWNTTALGKAKVAKQFFWLAIGTK